MLYTDPSITISVCVLVGILGACMGSFLNCMAWRIVHHESIVKGRSHCDSCGHVLGTMDLIPIAGYIIRRGRCPYCKSRFSARHLCVEVILAAAFVAIVLKYDITLCTLEYILFVCILTACSCADLEGYVIPDRFIIAGAVIRLVFIFISGNIVDELIDAAIGGIGVAGVLLLLVLGYEKLKKKEAMGGGDIKLLFVTGLFLGWKGNILCLIFACILGIVFGLVSMHKASPEGAGTMCEGEAAASTEDEGAENPIDATTGKTILCAADEKHTESKQAETCTDTGADEAGRSDVAESYIEGKQAESPTVAEAGGAGEASGGDVAGTELPQELTRAIPWGPSIAAAAFIVLMVGDLLINLYMGLF